MFPTIILFVTSVSLPEQDTTRKGRVYEMYEMYEMYEIYEMYEMYEMYEITLSQPVSPLIPSTHDGSAAQKRFRSPGSTYPSYDSANSSALQATAARGTHGRVIVNDAQPVIDDTSTMTT